MDPLLDPSPEELVQAIEDNWLGWLPLFEHFEGGRLEHRDGYARWFSSIRIPYFNGITGIPVSDDLDAGIDEALAPFDEGDIPLLWVVPGSTDLDGRLAARGFEIERPPGMTIDLSLLPPARPQAGSPVVEVRSDPVGMEAAIRVTQIANGMPDETTPPLLRALERFPGRDRIRMFLATVDGEAAASSTLFEWGGVAGLYNVGTLPEYRGRGLGTLVSLTAMEAGRADGYRFGALQATAMGEAVYRSIGFEERCQFTFAVREARGAAPM